MIRNIKFYILLKICSFSKKIEHILKTIQQLLDEFEKQNNVKINYKYVEKRDGDLETSFGDVSLIKKELNWNSEYNLNDIVLLSNNNIII